jgi:hypothetical protein
MLEKLIFAQAAKKLPDLIASGRFISLPCSQQPDKEPYFEPDESIPNPHKAVKIHVSSVLPSISEYPQRSGLYRFPD